MAGRGGHHLGHSRQLLLALSILLPFDFLHGMECSPVLDFCNNSIYCATERGVSFLQASAAAELKWETDCQENEPANNPGRIGTPQ